MVRRALPRLPATVAAALAAMSLGTATAAPPMQTSTSDDAAAPPVQAPRKAPAPPAPDGFPAEVEPATTVAPPVEPPDDAAKDAIDSAPSLDPAPDLAPAATAPQPRVDAGGDGLSLLGTSLWTGLMQRRVRLTLDGGAVVSGVLISQSPAQLGVAEGTEGRLVAVDKAAIRSVEVEARTQLPPNGDGTGLLAGGGLLLGLGIPTTIAGLTFTFLVGPTFGLFFLPGPLAMGAGIPMVAVGNKRKRAHTEALRRARLGQLTPQLNVGPHGGTAGVHWRF